MNSLQTIHPEFLSLNGDQIHALMPYFWIFGGIVLGMLASILRVVNPKWPVFLITVASAAGAAVSSFTLLQQDGALKLFNGMMVTDHFSNFFNIAFLVSAILTILASFRYLD